MSKQDDHDTEPDAEAERMLTAALGGLTPREALLEATRAKDADSEARAKAIALNRERAQRLLAELEKTMGKTD